MTKEQLWVNVSYAFPPMILSKEEKKTVRVDRTVGSQNRRCASGK